MRGARFAPESMCHPKHVASLFNLGIYEGVDMKRLVQGVGLNDADYQVTIRGDNGKMEWICPFYQRWKSMLHRCYSDSYHAKKPSYKKCFVCNQR